MLTVATGECVNYGLLCQSNLFCWCKHPLWPPPWGLLRRYNNATLLLSFLLRELLPQPQEAACKENINTGNVYVFLGRTSSSWRFTVSNSRWHGDFRRWFYSSCWSVLQHNIEFLAALVVLVCITSQPVNPFKWDKHGKSWCICTFFQQVFSASFAAFCLCSPFFQSRWLCWLWPQQNVCMQWEFV